MRLLLCIAFVFMHISCIESCCAPSVLQGTAMKFGLIAETKNIYQNMVKFYYDAEEKKVAKIATNMMGEKVTEIEDYSAKKRYVITNDGCNVTKLTEEFQKSCVPSDAKFMGKTVLGNTKDNLTVDNYNAVISKGGVPIEAKLIVAPMDGGKCTLVGYVAFVKGKNGFEASETVLYSNFAFEIPDKSVFTPPKSCSEPDFTETLLFEVLVGFRRDVIN